MYDDWSVNLTVAAGTLGAVVISVLLHYEGLVLVSRTLARMGGLRRVKVLYGIISVITLHVAEIWVFGLTLWLLLSIPGAGAIAGLDQPALIDLVYLSANTFTTLGFGDLAPVGPIRFLAGTEALTGFVLIAWSASFTYLEMDRFWRNP